MNGRRGNSKSASRPKARRNDAVRVLGEEDATLLDLVDNALNRGVVLTGELTIALANIDLVYARLSLLLCAADRVLPGEPSGLLERRTLRRARVRRLTRRG